ncbi:MAG: hypothetical protein PUC65_08380 [Clostridiales bacterium]|nr:hypothetical protein [Clostridiales bacterium]
MKHNTPNFNDEKNAQKKMNEKFNSITQKVKVENQNQTHNSKKEGFGPQQRPEAF